MPARASHLDPAFERAVREILYDKKLPCPVCRYDLRGLTRPMCPECGSEVEAYLRVADLSPRRIRAQRRERAMRVAGRVFMALLFLLPLLAAVIVVMLT
jgi:hypothetical protein